MKKLFAITLGAVLMVTSINSYATTISFKDTTKHWSKTYINRLYKEGYVKGSNGNFNPEQVLKTEDFLIMVLKVIKPEYKDLVATEGQTYYAPFIEKAVEIGLIKGDFNADEVQQYIERSMPRELAVQVVDRALTLMGETVTVDHGLEYKFGDFKIVNDINKEAVLKAYQLGIIKGSNGNFEPKNPLTRAESAVLVTKLMDKTMRDKMVFSKNTKDYGETINYFIKEFQKQVAKRTVVIEKKSNGVINTGDVDYTENNFKIGKYVDDKFVIGTKNYSWWTDQQFEDETTGLSTTSGERSSTRVGLSVSDLDFKELLGLDRVGGSFLPIDGELMFLNINDKQNGKTDKFYNMPVKNFNRLSYDLCKYNTQYATLKNYKFLQFTTTDSHFFYGLSRTGSMDQTKLGYVYINTNPKQSGELEDIPFAPQVGFSARDYETLVQEEVLFQQWFTRIYGTDDGAAIYKMFKEFVKGKDGGSKSKAVDKIYKGIKLHFTDAKGVDPNLQTTLK